MVSIPDPGLSESPVPPFRVDEELRELLTKPLPAPGVPLAALGPSQPLPEPVFPQHPELLADMELPQDRHDSSGDPY